MGDRELLPVGKDAASMKLVDDIGHMLMDFVVHNQKPYSKTLQKFIAKGLHDIRAGLVAVHIIARIQQYLDEIKQDE